MERSYNNSEYIKYIKENIKHAKDPYVCMNCFDTRERKIKKENIVRLPKRTAFYQECDGCSHNRNGTCQKCYVGDTLGIGDYEEIPLPHRCEVGRKDRNGKLMSMSELCCPVCHKPVHKVIGKNIIISVIGARDSGKSHYIGVLMHELMNRLAVQFEWIVIPEENTLRIYRAKYEKMYTTNQILNLTSKNFEGYFEPYIFYITDKNGKTFTITIFDTAGEDFESDDLMENSAKHAFHASGIVFLVDPLKILNVYTRLSQETVKYSSSVSPNRVFKNDAILSILSTGLRHHYKIKDNEKISVPIAVLTPKLDIISSDFPAYCACLFQSIHSKKQGFVTAENRRINTEIRKWMAGLEDGSVNSFMSQLKLNYKNYSYFAASALGMKNAPDQNGLFGVPRPHRVEDPLLWILKEKRIIQEIKRL